MYERTLFQEEHNAFRDSVRRFIERQVTPRYRDWENAGALPREFWREAGAAGLLCPEVPEEYGGPGCDVLFSAIVHEELERAGAHAVSANLIAHNDVIGPYLLAYGTAEQKARWLPGLVSGEIVGSIGMSEPGAGSDLKAIRTVARPSANGFVLSGQKTFITNGSNCDLIVVAAKTSPDAGAKGVSLLMVDTSLPGFRRGQLLDKIGQRAADTTELFFDDIELARDCILGNENGGFAHMMEMLPRERLSIAICAAAQADAAIDWTLAYVKERQVFGRALSELQATRFKIAELASDAKVARVFVDWCLERAVAGTLDVEAAAIAKYWVTEKSHHVIDGCLQLFGGYGYMRDFPISRLWVDSRAQRIYGGTSEVMKELIGREILKNR